MPAFAEDEIGVLDQATKEKICLIYALDMDELDVMSDSDLRQYLDGIENMEFI